MASGGASEPVMQPKEQAIAPGQQKTLYDSDADSGAAKCIRSATCMCLAQKSQITTEQIRTREWNGCSHAEKSFDIDAVTDVQLRETFGPCLLMCKRGNIRVYGNDRDQKEHYFTLKRIENAGEVYLKLGELVNKVNNLKFGMNRPDDPNIPHTMYNSKDDPIGVKCTRVVCCCGCFRPTTVITKSGITISKWQVNCSRVTKRMDIDSIKDLSTESPCYMMCCGAGNIRVFGQDEDQTDEHFDITWIAGAKEKFRQLDRYQNLINNRERVGFEA